MKYKPGGKYKSKDGKRLNNGLASMNIILSLYFVLKDVVCLSEIKTRLFTFLEIKFRHLASKSFKA